MSAFVAFCILALRCISNLIFIFDIFCSGNRKDTKGTAFVVYEDIYDAKNARDHLSGFNVKDRYINVLYHSAEAMQKKIDVEKKKKENEALRAKLQETPR